MMQSAAALDTRTVGDITEKFWVPSYQRGYRWGPHEVQLLLDDIEASNGSSYYLQPVVVRPRESRWELIDGQQRMTTLYLLLRHMERTGLQSVGPAFSIEYETRTNSQAYLDEPDEDGREDNIDFWHIHLANRAIADWFEQKAHRKQVIANDLYGYLFKSVKVIWYVAPPDLDEVELFTRLNVGRIPLTNAELVKALVLTSSDERSHEVAAEWDSIERALRQPDVWAFASGRSGEEPTHISLLLDTLAVTSCSECASGRHGKSERERPVFHTFEVLRKRTVAEGWKRVWDEVVDLYSLVLGWFEDRGLFHKVGYLVATGTPLRNLAQLAADLPKSAFADILCKAIRDQLALTEDEVRSLDYEADRTKCEQVLLLMNVETVRRRTSSQDRFPFAEHARHAWWSLEHVHAQNAQELTKAEQWLTWLDLHAKALAALPGAHTPPVPSLLAEIATASENISENSFRSLSERIIAQFELSAEGEGFDVHGISNLALLARDINSALSNSVFEAKREHIVEVDKRGGYIPPATRNVFLKYYTAANAQQIHFWGVQDREAYLNALIETVGDYLLEESQS